jgi:two-component system sensor histidine kinase ChvG
MKKIFRFFSRITVRLLCFNVLIVFLPVAGFLYLDTYEKQLVKSLEDSMAQQGRLVSSALSDQPNKEAFSKERLGEASNKIIANLMKHTESRLRIIDKRGKLIADSSVGYGDEDEANTANEYTDRTLNRIENSDSKSTAGKPKKKEARENLLYRIASYPIALYRRYFLPPQPGTEPLVADSTGVIRGPEVQNALLGRYGATTRISSGGQRSVTLYSAVPIRYGDSVVGAVVVSQSTYRILKDLYELRLAIFRIFIGSVIAATALSLFLSFTIGRPLKKLKLEAEAIVDQRGRMKRPFRSVKWHDEIGDLSRSLVKLTEQIESHISFIESFAGDISHEFKNPLASIRSSAELALSVHNRNEKDLFLSKILDDIIRMERLLTGVREISRIDAQLADEESDLIDLSVLLRNIATACEQRQTGCTLSLDLRVPGVAMRASHYRLTEVFENLIDNAVSFSKPDSPILIALSLDNRIFRISVRDRGPGIPPEHLDKIFTRFFTYRPDGKKKKEHMGLGLSIVKAIVEGYGGTVSAANRPDGGAEFIVEFPFSSIVIKKS